MRNLTTCTIVDALAVARQLPDGVASGQFENGDECVVLGVLGMDDDIVIVSARTGSVFTIYMDGASVRVNN